MSQSVYQDMKRRLRPGQLLDLLLTRVPGVAFFVKDTQYRFVTGNRALLQLLGATSVDEIVGKTDLAFTADFLADAFRADDRSVLEEGRVILDQKIGRAHV